MRVGLLLVLCAACRSPALNREAPGQAATTQATPDRLTLVGRARVSAVYDVEVVPPRAYALERGILRVLDVRDAGSVREVGSLELPHAYARMALRHPYLYLSGFGAPLTIVDISNPLQPRWVGDFPQLSGARNDIIELDEEVGYLVTLLDTDPNPPAPAATSLALDVFDLSDPERPRQLARLDLGVQVRGEYGGIARLGSQVFVVVTAPLPEAGRSQLISIDARVPDRPTIVRRADLPEELRVVDIEPAGDRLFAIYGGPGASTQGLAVFEQGPAGEVNLLGRASDTRFWMPIDLIVHGDAVFATFKGKVKLATFDVSDPLRPRVARAYETDDPFVAGLGLTLADDRLYMASDGGPMPIFDVTQPLAPRLLGRWEFEGGWATDVVIDGGLALVSNGWAGLLMYDVTDPRVPRRLARYYISGVVADPWVVIAARSGRDLLLTHAGQPAELVDISDPAAPRSVTRFDPGGLVMAALFRDGIALLGGALPGVETQATGAGWLSVVRVGEGPPVPLAKLSLPGAVVDLTRAGEFAVAAHPDGTVTAIDLTDPVRPRITGTTGTPGRHGPAEQSLATRRSRIAAGPEEGIVYAATMSAHPTGGDRLSLSVIAIDASGQPFLRGQVALGSADWPAPVVAARGDRVLVGVDRRLVTVDASDPRQPAVLADQRLTTSIEGLAVSGEHVFVGAGEDGLWIFKWP